jgi:glutamine amidotransferase
VRVAVIDYGAGNLRSVVSALRSLDCDAVVVESPGDIHSARAMILPGVGAAADTMENLHARGLSDVFGICMGMQVLFTHSDEGGGQQCLGILPGRVVRLPDGLKVPHMGWNQVCYAGEHAVFRAIPDGSDFYFVHSYVAQPDDECIVAARTEYGTTFCSAVQRGLLFATQFHPEKSGSRGLQLYKSFLETAAS